MWGHQEHLRGSTQTDRTWINLDEFEEWKQLMKLKMSPEFIKMINNFTQIPQLAVRDISENRPEHSEKIDPWGG